MKLISVFQSEFLCSPSPSQFLLLLACGGQPLCSPSPSQFLLLLACGQCLLCWSGGLIHGQSFCSPLKSTSFHVNKSLVDSTEVSITVDPASSDSCFPGEAMDISLFMS